MNPRLGFFLFASLLFILITAILLITQNPKYHFLYSTSNAEWIKAERPFELVAKNYQNRVAYFRKSFEINDPAKQIHINVTAFKYFQFFLDGELLYQSHDKNSNWKEPHRIDIPITDEDKHEILLAVMNFNAPPALLTTSNLQQLNSNSGWLASYIIDKPRYAVSADQRHHADLTDRFNSSYTSLFNISLFVIIILALFALTITALNKYSISISNKFGEAVIILAFSLLSISDLLYFPLAGYDYLFHIEYIKYVGDNYTIPIATTGWQMFQSPLYYIISAIILKVSNIFLSPEYSIQSIKLVSLTSGLLLAMISYRCVLLVLPNSNNIKMLAILFSIGIPVNLYMSQYIGNEALAATFSAAAVYYLIQIIKFPNLATSRYHLTKLGIVLGLSLLTKVTAILLMPPVFAMLIILQNHQKVNINTISINVTLVLLVISGIAGWYYIRNWILLGTPFMGGWDPARGSLWWQDPGYRTFSDFTRFGRALLFPIYSGTQGFWDAFYSTLWADGFLGGSISLEESPPWNYQYLLSSMIFSFLPTFGILRGLIGIHLEPDSSIRRSLAISCILILIYIMAMIYLYLKIPIYSTAKASYTLGLLPCYALLCIYGINKIILTKFLQYTLLCSFACWSILNYIAYYPV